MTFALFAVTCLALAAGVFCVASAVFMSRALHAARSLRSMTSMQGELAEIRDYMGKMDRWAKRINAREVMNENKDPVTGLRKPSSARVSSIGDKDELRRRAGLVAGQPARHHEQG